MIIRELKDRRDIRLFNVLMGKYHKQGNNPGLSRCRYFVGIVHEDGIDYWVAGAIIQHPSAFAPIFTRYRIDMSNSYFLRRIARFVPSSCGDLLVVFLDKLSEQLKSEGKEALVTLGLEDHSNKLYKLAGFVEIGKTLKNNKPVFVKYLQKNIEKPVEMIPKDL